MSVPRRRTVVYLNLHAGDTPTPVDRPDGQHPSAGDLVAMVGWDGPGCYEVERVDHDLTGGRHVVRVFVERADPFPARPGRTLAQCPRAAVTAAAGESADARLVV